MNELEKRIAEAINEKLNDGTVEKLIEQHIEKAVSESMRWKAWMEVKLGVRRGWKWYISWKLKASFLKKS